MNKKAIIVASFGTSYLEVLNRSIKLVEDQVAEEFPDFEIRRVFTSNMVRKALLKKEGIKTDSLEEALDKLEAEGYQEVYIQTLHIIPGEEYHEKIIKPASRYRDRFKVLKTGKSLLFATEDYFNAINALKNQMPQQEEDLAVILMGHGATHPANSCYAALQLKLFDEIPNAFIANIEGYPELDDILEKISGYKKLLLMPFMLVAGDHAINDMAGDEEDSWKNILSENGYQVEIYMKGLGENPEIRKIYINHIKDMLAE
jgi:sirohydrochlorin cobaltochelatase